MTYFYVIAAVIIVVPVLIALLSISISLEEISDLTKQIGSELDSIRYEMHPDPVPMKESMRVMIDELKKHCEEEGKCAGCDYEGACPGYVVGCPEKWGKTE